MRTEQPSPQQRHRFVWALVLAAAPGTSGICHGQLVVDAGGQGTHVTVQSAIDDAANGQVIVVNPGVYAERITFAGKRITVRSTVPDDPAVVAATVIDGQAGGSVVTFADGETAETVLEGLTIRNGVSTYGGGIYCVNQAGPTILLNRIVDNYCVLHGGGIYCAAGASPIILDNEIEGNFCEGRGGGIYVDASSAWIEGNGIRTNSAGCASGGGIHLGLGSDAVVVLDNDIVGNGATFGGGIQIEDASPRIERNRIIGNVGDPRGGGISCVDGAPIFLSNLIAGNRAEVAAAVECNNAPAVFRHNTFVGNRADQAAVILALNGSAIELTGNVIAFHSIGVAVQAVTGASATVDHNCFFDNVDGDTSGTMNFGVNNIFVDPQLAAPGTWVTGPPTAAPICGGVLQLGATLAGAGGMSGTADYRFGPDRERFRVDVAGFPPGTHDVTINAVIVGQLSVAGDGQGSLNYDTDDGTLPPGFPVVNNGDTVSVGGLVSGTLEPQGAVYTESWSAGDEHLLPTSPCVNAGPIAGPVDGEADIDGQPRSANGTMDIGADELVPPGTGDGDQDGDVDLRDLAQYQVCFSGPGGGLPSPTCASVDLDADLDVDLADWAAMDAAFTGP